MASLKKGKSTQTAKLTSKKTESTIESVLTEPRPPWLRPRRADVLTPLIVENALTDDAHVQPHLMSIKTLYEEGVKIAIPRWAPGGGGPFASYFLEIKNNNSLLRPREDLGRNLDAPGFVWPRPYTITEAEMGDHGIKNLSYEVFHGATADRARQVTKVTIDRYDPMAGIRPSKMTLPAWVVDGVVTLELFGVPGNLFTLTCPARLDPQEGDTLEVYFHYTDADPVKTVINLPVTKAPVDVTLTLAEILTGRDSGVYQMAYIYKDLSGNETSFPPHLTEITLSVTPSPTNLQAPAVPEAPLDREDAQLNRAYVRITGYDHSAIGDQIVISFNEQVFYGTINSLAFPHDFPIPWTVLAAGGETAPYTATVFYYVVRDLVPSADSPSIDVAVDLTAPGLIPDPGGPGPVNPNLGRITITSSLGETNKIGMGDTGNATATFAVYTGAVAGDRIQIFWHGLPALTPPYTVLASDLGNPEFSIPVPAAAIAMGGNGDKDVYYSLNNGSNNNFIDSLPTPVLVEAFVIEDLETIKYPNALPIPETTEDDHLINCDLGITSGILTRIISPGKLKAGDKITLVWVVYGPDDYFSMVEVVRHEFPPVTVTLDHFEGHPGELFTVPFATYISPIMEGRVEAYYKVDAGATPGESDPSVLYITRKRLGGGLCG